MVLLALIITLCFSAFIFAQNNHRIIKVGYYDCDSFNEINNENAICGYNIDYLEKISEYTDYEYEYIEADYGELLSMLYRGEIDLMCACKEDSLLPGYLYTEPIFHSYTKIITRYSDSRFDMGDVQLLDNKKVGVIDDGKLEKELDDYLAYYDIMTDTKSYDNEADLVLDLQIGKLDAAIIDSDIDYDSIRTIAVIDIDDYSYMLSDNNKEVFMELNAAISYIKMHYPCFESKLMEKWYNGDTGKELFLNVDEEEYIKQAEPIKVAILPNRFVLSNYDEKTGEFIGVEPELLNEISRISGLEFEMIEVPEGSTFAKSVEDGVSDAAFGIGIPNQVAEGLKYSYTKTIYYSPTVLAVRKGELFNLDADNVIAVPPTFPYGIKYIEDNYSNWEIVYTGDLFERLKDVDDGKADCTIISKYELQYLLQMPQNSGLMVYPKELFDIEIGMIVSNDVDAVVIDILNKSIDVLNNTTRDSIITASISENIYKQTFWDSIVVNKVQYIIIVLFAIFVFVLFVILYKQQKKNNRKLKSSNQLLVKAYDEIKKSEAKARKANKIKTDFMARMSHDMRTPMGAIISFSDFGLEEIEDTKAREYFKRIRESSEYLMELVNDVLDVQKMDSDRLILNIRVVNINDVIDQIVNIIGLQAEKKGIEFELINDLEEECYIKADEKRIKQVALNLLNNSVKYTDKGGKITWKIEGQQRNNKIKIISVIEDNGIGMSEKFQKQMFEPFAKELSAKVKTEEGSGLGLAITKKVVEAIGGTISCKSKLNEGTMFIVSVVFEKATEKEALDAIRIVGNKKDKRLILKSKKILICEDNEINAKIIKKILDGYNMVCDIAMNGLIGVEKARSGNYDAVIMDIKMPVMDGLEAAKRIRKFDKGIPIIALSANAYVEDEKKSIEAGMNYHLCKPINKDELISVLRELLSK
jgi:signal transduction histidine kinase/CheY-like chemotaxis protein